MMPCQNHSLTLRVNKKTRSVIKMCLYFDHEKLKERCKDPTFCIACCRNRNDYKVDKHHVCEECRKGSDGMPKRLPVITLKNGKSYYIDERLKQLRNVCNPHDYIDW